VFGLAEGEKTIPDWVISEIKRISKEHDVTPQEVAKMFRSLMDDPAFAKNVPDFKARAKLALISIDSRFKARSHTRVLGVDKYEICPFGFEQFKSGKMRIYAYIPKQKSKVVIVVNRQEILEQMDELKAFKYYEVELSRSSANPDTMFVTDESKFVYRRDANVDRFEFFNKVLGIPVVSFLETHEHIARVMEDGNVDPLDLRILRGVMRDVNVERGRFLIVDPNIPDTVKLGKDAMHKVGDVTVVTTNPIPVWAYKYFLTFGEATGFVVGRIGLRPFRFGLEEEGSEEEGEKEEYHAVSFNAIYVHPDVVLRELEG